MRTRWLDRVLVGAVVLLVVGIAAQSIASRLGGGHGSGRPTLPTIAAPAPVTVDNGFHDLGTYRSLSLRSSPETQFLATCSLGRLRLAVEPGPRLWMRYSGPPCVPPVIELTAVIRNPDGGRARRVPALDPPGRELLSRHLAGSDSIVVPLASGLLRCRSGRPDDLRATKSGHLIRGTIPCRGQH